MCICSFNSQFPGQLGKPVPKHKRFRVLLLLEMMNMAAVPTGTNNKGMQIICIKLQWVYQLPSVLWHCWLGDRKGISPVKGWVLVCWWFAWSFACLMASAVTTTSTILSSNKIQKWDIMVPAYPGCSGKWLLNTCLCLYACLLSIPVYQHSAFYRPDVLQRRQKFCHS